VRKVFDRTTTTRRSNVSDPWERFHALKPDIDTQLVFRTDQPLLSIGTEGVGIRCDVPGNDRIINPYDPQRGRRLNDTPRISRMAATLRGFDS
jgi:hypothetical protein